MEKHHSRSSAKRVLPVDVDSFDLPSLGIGSGAPPGIPTSGLEPSGKHPPDGDKLSREDISRCINIWASVYLKRDTPTDPGDLRLPARPWLGRNPNSLKRFE